MARAKGTSSAGDYYIRVSFQTLLIKGGAKVSHREPSFVGGSHGFVGLDASPFVLGLNL